MTPPLPNSDEIGLDLAGQEVDRIGRTVLGDDYRHFTLNSIEFVENVAEQTVTVTTTITRSGHDETFSIKGDGVGLIDAFFDGVMKVFGEEYPSLKTIAVSDFSLTAGFENAKGRRSDALAVAKLMVRNSYDREYGFEHGTPSVTRSSIRVALDALTFFINSERAYITLHRALDDAKERRRPDLVERYTHQLSTMVKATSYSELIERITGQS